MEDTLVEIKASCAGVMAAIIGGTIVLSIRILKSGGARRDQAEGSRVIQEIYQGLSRMEHIVTSPEFDWDEKLNG